MDKDVIYFYNLSNKRAYNKFKEQFVNSLISVYNAMQEVIDLILGTCNYGILIQRTEIVDK